MSNRTLRGFSVVASLLGLCLGARFLKATEPPAEDSPRPDTPRFIYTRPLTQVDGKTISPGRTWLLYDMKTHREYLVIDGAGTVEIKP